MISLLLKFQPNILFNHKLLSSWIHNLDPCLIIPFIQNLILVSNCMKGAYIFGGSNERVKPVKADHDNLEKDLNLGTPDSLFQVFT